jgi:4-hydroxy 2-oxovalerate aldolase
VEWGPLVQYNITGQLNEHPRSAIAARGGQQRDRYVEFYDRLVNDIDM